MAKRILLPGEAQLDFRRLKSRMTISDHLLLCQGSKGSDHELIPGIHNDVMIHHILTKVPWQMLYVGTCVNRLWKKTLRSNEVYDARVRADSARTLVAMVNGDGDVGYGSWQQQPIFFYDSSTSAWHLRPRLPNFYNRKPWVCGCVFLRTEFYTLGGWAEHPSHENTVHYFDVEAENRWTPAEREGSPPDFSVSYGILPLKCRNTLVYRYADFLMQVGRLETFVGAKRYEHFPYFGREGEKFTNDELRGVEGATFLGVIDGKLYRMSDLDLYVYEESSELWKFVHTVPDSDAWEKLRQKRRCHTRSLAQSSSASSSSAKAVEDLHEFLFQGSYQLQVRRIHP